MSAPSVPTWWMTQQGETREILNPELFEQLTQEAQQ